MDSRKKTSETSQSLIRRPNGIVLVTGPTGSGKTTTLYASLNALNRPDRKIITAEDPVEYYLPGINQCEVKHNIGLDFALIIRAMLRQAPNIILVGEMRDNETASMGIQASLTGHLVFSTLHTNDAPSAATRMMDMGVPSYLVASSVIAVLAQRLVRTVCPRCKTKYKPPERLIRDAGLSPELVKKSEFVKGKGCTFCQRSGYRGRIGIYELMLVRSEIREMMFQARNSQDIRVAAIGNGMTTLYADGMRKVMRGITTFEEVYRVAKKVSRTTWQSRISNTKICNPTGIMLRPTYLPLRNQGLLRASSARAPAATPSAKPAWPSAGSTMRRVRTASSQSRQSLRCRTLSLPTSVF